MTTAEKLNKIQGWHHNIGLEFCEDILSDVTLFKQAVEMNNLALEYCTPELFQDEEVRNMFTKENVWMLKEMNCEEADDLIIAINILG